MTERSTQSFPFSQFVRMQLVAGVTVVVLLSLVFGQNTIVLFSALQGIAIAVLVNSWYCWRVYRDFREVDRRSEQPEPTPELTEAAKLPTTNLTRAHEQAHEIQGLEAEHTIARLYRSELLKLLVAAVLLGLSFKLGHVAHDAVFIVAFSLAWLISATLVNVLANRT